ncbi:hypothetical protein [Pelolinea submarina]|uniref:Acetyltransferase AlgX (SGNH hydrolase-like protein) n=1 Tax=Pelolinea submarina TaxID=913107 RepID=A0A347ZW07_9CHLR|nr:hypothetical protein [Pelolinea submarina]REG07184.1 hypothetical protein DFR64_2388 [Pelolinea submarina]BBB49488.1 hypothetical protein Pelsub_P2719 [Pelolinea submarina]
MKKYIQNLVFILIIFALLISPLIFWLSRNGAWTEDSILEDRKLVVFPQVSVQDFKIGLKRVYQGLYAEAGEVFFNRFISGSFQRTVNKAAAEQMLLRIPLVELAKSFDRAVIHSAYAALPDEAYPASFNSGLYVDRRGENLMQDLALFNQAEKEAIDTRIANYEQLLAEYPDIHFYVYNIETLPYSRFYPLNAYFPQADNGQSLDYFLANKPENLAFANFALNSYADYQKRFFRTDQHWNIRASLDAYEQIYALLKDQYPDISPMLTAEAIKKIDGLEFQGSMARKSLYPVEPDILEYANVSMPAYDTYVDGELSNYSGRENYLNGIYSREKFFNHYRGFYGKQQILIQFHFNNETRRNLLMVTSSYSRTIQMYLASHFHDTYVIDLRFEENSTKRLQQFIDDYDITDVLVFGQPTVTYYSAEDAIKP